MAAKPSGRLLRFLLLAFLSASLLLCAGAAGVVGAYFYYSRDLPTPAQLVTSHLQQSTKIYDRTGQLLFEVYDAQGGKRTLVQASEVSAALKDATLATEDPTFYSNLGIDPVAVLRALYYDVRYGKIVQGGSTITQQLVKNVFLSPQPTVERKVREAFLAVALTLAYSKEQILGFYLNTIYYGHQAYGVQAAAQTYFNKDVSQLSLGESTLLAGLPQAPARYDPCESPEAALARQGVVLQLMQEHKRVTAAQAQAAAQEAAATLSSEAFDRRCATQNPIRAPHFVNYVRALLEDRYGPEVVYKDGLEVTTALDPDKQVVLEEEARKQIEALRGKNVTNAAAVILDAHTGEILAMLGSVDFYNKAISGEVNVATAPRQPGSSIKPLNYVTAFGAGWTPATPVYDLRTEFPNGNGQAPYVPADYDLKERGLVTVRQALANSLNIPAVKALYLTSTPDANKYPQPKGLLETARKLGITTLTNPDGKPTQSYGLALTLGGGEVTLLELTGAYAAFANQGARPPSTPFLKIVDGNGKVLYDGNGRDRPKPECARFDPGAPNEQPDANGVCAKSAPYAYLITSILSDDPARALAFGANSPLTLSRPAAAKTGTTNDFRDNWTMGYTPDLVAGVWVGNSNNSPMEGVTGLTGAAPLWHAIMERVNAGRAPAEFPVPAGVVRAEVCSESGLLPTALCPADHRRSDLFVAGHAPGTKDTVWQSLAFCGAPALVYQVPVHDVKDAIPYSRIVDWARAAGWHVPPGLESGSATLCAPAGIGAAPAPNNNPNNSPGNGKDKGNGNGNGNGNGKGKGKK